VLDEVLKIGVQGTHPAKVIVATVRIDQGGIKLAKVAQS